METDNILVKHKGFQLSNWLALCFPAVGEAAIRHSLRSGEVLVNGRVTKHGGWILQTADKIGFKPNAARLFIAPPNLARAVVLFADKDLLVLDKPAGMLSHPSPQGKGATILHCAAQFILEQGKANMQRPFLLHRLDRDTTGVIALARNERAASILTKAFQEQRVKKNYIGLAQGVVGPDSGEIDAAIGPTPKLWPRWRILEGGAKAVTKYQVVKRFKEHTLLSFAPVTGRTHQIRIHAAFLGHPLVGDPVYRAGKTLVSSLGARRQLLHAQSLTLPHPATGKEITVAADLPQDLQAALECLEREF